MTILLLKNSQPVSSAKQSKLNKGNKFYFPISWWWMVWCFWNIDERCVAFWIQKFRNTAVLQPVGLLLCQTAFLSLQTVRSSQAHSSTSAEISFSNRTRTLAYVQVPLHKVYVAVEISQFLLSWYRLHSLSPRKNSQAIFLVPCAVYVIDLLSLHPYPLLYCLLLQPFISAFCLPDPTTD